MDLIDGFRVFVAAVESGSFAAAGERLGISGKLASKYLGELEDRLGVRLLQRTTRRLGMTVAGENLYGRLPHWLDELDEIRSDLKESGSGLSGTLRVSAPLTFGELLVQQMLRRFQERHPDLIVDLRLSDSYVDLAAEGIDTAIRIGNLANSALIARKLGETAMVMVATPAYLERCGNPQRPEYLQQHECIRDTNLRTPGGGWPLVDNDEPVRIPVHGHYLVNSARVARDICLEGQGIALCPDYVVGDDIASGQLVQVLKPHQPAPLDIHAVYLEGRRMPRRLRAFLDFLKTEPLRFTKV
ncbi:LysR family transcriptional regulator [Martelella mangrovi]|uniref:DNA-binding transcriptional LysR family regulator n=1 Tax=Martelella mangrovi TaxID=1397477 RepID=A0ABV2IBC5_9HYPH